MLDAHDNLLAAGDLITVVISREYEAIRYVGTFEPRGDVGCVVVGEDRYACTPENTFVDRDAAEEHYAWAHSHALLNVRRRDRDAR